MSAAAARARFACAILITTFAASAGAQSTQAQRPNVVVSIKPVHSLVAAVMSDIGEPHLLIRGSASPHTYSLRPSDAQAVERADVVVYVGEALETMLVRPIERRRGSARLLRLIETPGMTRYPLRPGGIWASDGRGHEGNHPDIEPEHRQDGRWDSHIWLDPRNAARIVRHVARELAAFDAAESARYLANRDAALEQLSALDETISSTLQPLRERPFIVFHDAFQYFERRYGLRGAGAVTFAPDRQPGPRRIMALRRHIATHDIECVFIEPQFPTDTVRMMVEGTGARIATLDPLGADLPAGPDMYGALLRRLAAAIVNCLDREDR